MNRNVGDLSNLASHLTMRRSVNVAKLFGGYYYSRLRKSPWQVALPAAISIEPTTSCNLRCPECPSGLRSFSRPTGMLEQKFFEEIIRQIREHVFYLTFYFQGEPYLNPDFPEMVSYATRNDIYTATSTNAHYLNDENARRTVESGLDRLIISIDGAKQESYEKYRIGGMLEKVMEGTENVLRWKKKLRRKTLHMIWQFILMAHNEHEVDEVRAMANKLGVDEVALKTVQVYDYENGSELIPSEGHARYANQDGVWKIKNKLLNHCWKMWHSCVITWDGNVVPCCFDKDASHPLGSLKEKSFKEIWFSEAYHEFRKQLLMSRAEIDICKNCTEGTSVWAG